MKKGYIKLLLMEFFLMVVLFINSFIFNLLSGYWLILFMSLILIFFKYNFGLEKDRHANSREIIKTILIYLLLVLVIYYAIGFISGFAYNENYYTIKGLFTFIIPTIMTGILSEYLRYQFLQKSEGNNLLIICTVFIFTFIDISNSIYYGDFKTTYSFLVFIGLYMLPSIFQNVCYSYLSVKSGYRPTIVLSLLLGVTPYLLSVIPNYSEFMKSIFNILVPTILLIYMLKYFDDRIDVELLGKFDSKKNIVANSVFICILLIVTYFVSGYFKYSAIAIASGSMTPTFTKGSVVIVKKIDDKNTLEVGNIIAYNYEGKIVVHRLNKIVEVRQNRYYYTKGDANENEDNYKVDEDMIIGVVNVAIPFIGYPTVWLSEL